ncbi:MAG: 6-phosphofructokinase [Deltaproteobacteria bacterium]
MRVNWILSTVFIAALSFVSSAFAASDHLRPQSTKDTLIQKNIERSLKDGGVIPVIRRVGILTGGGPASGHNEVIYNVVLEGMLNGIEVIPIYEGWNGLMDDKLVTKSLAHGALTLEEVRPHRRKGGTFLKTSRANPYEKKNVENKVPEKIAGNIKKLGLDCLITCGGDDTNGAAQKLQKQFSGLRVRGMPKTMDNDMALPNGAWTYGFDSYVQAVTKAVFAAKNDAFSTNRAMVVEVFGRKAGFTAAAIGANVGAALTLIPEQGEIDLAEVVRLIKAYKQAHGYAVVMVSEGISIPYIKEEDREKVKNGEKTFANEKAKAIAESNTLILDRLFAKKKKLREAFLEVKDTDPHGNPKLEDAGPIIAAMLKLEGVEISKTEATYLFRSWDTSDYDMQLCATLGKGVINDLIADPDTNKLHYADDEQFGSLAPFPEKVGGRVFDYLGADNEQYMMGNLARVEFAMADGGTSRALARARLQPKPDYLKMMHDEYLKEQDNIGLFDNTGKTKFNAPNKDGLAGAHKKFNKYGIEIKFRGVTVIANPPEGLYPLFRQLREHLIDWQDRNGKFIIAPVAEGSEHITLYDLLSEADMTGKFGQLNAQTVKEINALMAARNMSKEDATYLVLAQKVNEALAPFANRRPPVFKPRQIAAFVPANPSVIVLNMEPADAQSLADVYDMQEAIYNKTGILNFFDYKAHVTLGYWVGGTTEKELADFTKELEALNQIIKSAASLPQNEFVMGPMELCYFSGMDRFAPIAKYNWNGQGNTSYTASAIETALSNIQKAEDARVDLFEKEWRQFCANLPKTASQKDLDDLRTLYLKKQVKIGLPFLKNADMKETIEKARKKFDKNGIEQLLAGVTVIANPPQNEYPLFRAVRQELENWQKLNNLEVLALVAAGSEHITVCDLAAGDNYQDKFKKLPQPLKDRVKSFVRSGMPLEAATYRVISEKVAEILARYENNFPKFVPLQIAAMSANHPRNIVINMQPASPQDLELLVRIQNDIASETNIDNDTFRAHVSLGYWINELTDVQFEAFKKELIKINGVFVGGAIKNNNDLFVMDSIQLSYFAGMNNYAFLSGTGKLAVSPAAIPGVIKKVSVAENWRVVRNLDGGESALMPISADFKAAFAKSAGPAAIVIGANVIMDNAATITAIAEIKKARPDLVVAVWAQGKTDAFKVLSQTLDLSPYVDILGSDGLEPVLVSINGRNITFNNIVLVNSVKDVEALKAEYGRAKIGKIMREQGLRTITLETPSADGRSGNVMPLVIAAAAASSVQGQVDTAFNTMKEDLLAKGKIDAKTSNSLRDMQRDVIAIPLVKLSDEAANLQAGYTATMNRL